MKTLTKLRLLKLNADMAKGKARILVAIAWAELAPVVKRKQLVRD